MNGLADILNHIRIFRASKLIQWTVLRCLTLWVSKISVLRNTEISTSNSARVVCIGLEMVLTKIKKPKTNDKEQNLE
jgi:hypothetical protein